MSDPGAVPQKYATRRLKKPASASFTCFQCGAQVGYDSDRCPQCRSFYVKDVKPEDVDELLRAEQERDRASDEIGRIHGSPLVHFDGEFNLMRLLEDDRADPGFVSECSRCGTVVEVETRTCPMCGTPLDQDDEGLVGVFKNMEFDPAPFEEADCPFCGEHVRLESGNCPECGRVLDTRDEGDPALKVLPVLRADNVVFMHLDIETGEIDILQRNAARRRYDQASMFLDLAENGGHGRTKPGLSRS
jgi:RNA polymerase subunit RPABC4/transcription elongation factor Spt4